MKLKATVAYNGSGFHGFAPNNDVPTITGAIEDALAVIFGEPVTITGAGRTDKGVHARGQVISFDVPEMIRKNRVESSKLERSLNGLCGPGIVVRDIVRVPDDFHARFSAKWRRYRYQVLTSRQPDPLRAHGAWHVWEPLDLEAMRAAAQHLVGEHDFSSFCRRPKVDDDAHEKLMDRTVAHRRVGRRRRTPPRVLDSRRRRFATRWCARSSARSSTSGCRRNRTR